MVFLAAIPLCVAPDHLPWLRWQLAIGFLALAAVAFLISQAMLQSKEDHERDEREKDRDSQLSTIKQMLEKLTTGVPVVAVAEATKPVEAFEPKAATDISIKFIRAFLVNTNPFSAFLGDIYRAANRAEAYTVESDFLFEVHLVNRSDVSTTTQRIVCEANINGIWIPLAQRGSLNDYQLEFEDEVDNPSWLGGKRKRVEDLVPDLAEELRGKVLSKGVGYRGWLRFGIDLDPKETSPIQHRIYFIDALDVSHSVNVVDPLLTDGKIIHNPTVWRERMRR